MKKDKQLLTGHRERTKERFLKSFNKNYIMSDVDLLELILFYSIPRRDVKDLAKELIEQFGSLAILINSNIDEIKSRTKLSDNTIVLFHIIQQSCKQLLLKEINNKPVLSSWQMLLDYCYATLAYEKNELVKILYINSKNRLVKDEVIHYGTTNSSVLYPREIIKRNFELGTTSFIIVHNHPSGDCTPSDEDIIITTQLSKIAADLDISLHDHIIIGKNGILSFKQQQFL